MDTTGDSQFQCWNLQPRDAEKIGFGDNSFYEILTGKERGKLQRRTACREDCLQLFQDYSRKTDTRY